MSHPTNPALEAAVVADAENDLPRLVYADWLEDHGDPARAAFIRTQIALHDKHPSDADYPDLVEARREVFDTMRGHPVLEPAMPDGTDFIDVEVDPDDDGFGNRYHRGFPYIVGEPSDLDEDFDGTVNRFRAALPALLARTTIRGLDFWGTFTHRLGRILSAKEVGRFTALSVVNPQVGRGIGAVAALARSPIRASLQWLGLDLNRDAEAAELAAVKFPRLKRWTAFQGFRCTPSALTRLFAADWFGRLERVLLPLAKATGPAVGAALAGCPRLHTLEAWGVTEGGVMALRRPDGFPALGRLQLHLPALGPRNTAALARAEFPKLAVFEVDRGIGNEQLTALAAADWFARLRVLKLASRDLGDQGVGALGQTPAAANLRSLTLDTPKIGRKTLDSLGRDYPALTTLNLSATLKKRATPADMTRFAAALGLSRLRHLNLDWWPVGDAAAAALAKNPALANLTRLSLDYTTVGAKGVRALLASPHLQRLRSLSLSGCPGGAGVAALADPGVLPNLAFCDLPNRVPKAVYVKLVQARGHIFLGGPG